MEHGREEVGHRAFAIAARAACREPHSVCTGCVVGMDHWLLGVHGVNKPVTVKVPSK